MERIFEILRTKIIDKGILFIDGWSFLHFFWGLGLSRTKFFGKGNYKKVFIALVVFELVEVFILQKPFLTPAGIVEESLIDSISDIVFGMLGYYMGSKYWK